jgi:hypothetical protein
MLAARKISRATFLVLVVCLICSLPTYPQSAAFLNVSKMPGSRIHSGAWLAKCQVFSVNLFPYERRTDGMEWPPTISGTRGISDDSSTASLPEGVCRDATSTIALRAPADNPCPQNAAAISPVPRTIGCNDAEDTVPADLSTLGKAGQKIVRAREEVLDILRSQNVCAEWFRSKGERPAATFQSLNFSLDLHGQQDIFKSVREESVFVVRQPYVARATQDGGAHTTITINANGAFYRPQGQVLKLGPEGGPLQLEGTRLLTVGIYAGDTLPAQMVTLLHELGHIINLLPEDADDLDGKSLRNTSEVLRHCRTEIEARAFQAKQMAKR